LWITEREGPERFEALRVRGFGRCCRQLPKRVQQLADANYELLKKDPAHPSLHFKKIGKYRTIRIDLHYRALAVEIPEGSLWFWLGSHAEYDGVLG
jgi:hypothetical protein